MRHTLGLMSQQDRYLRLIISTQANSQQPRCELSHECMQGPGTAL